MAKDYYSTLGLTKSATADEIKRAYKKLAVKFHPDVNKEKGAEEKFKEINEAYQVLSDPKKKQSYDQFGSADFAGRGGSAGGGQGFGGFDFSGFQQAGGGGFEDIFDMFFGGQGGGRSQSRNTGRSLEMLVETTFEEAVFGVEKKLSYNIADTCQTCSGAGGFDLETCASCRGSGQISKTTRTILGSFAQSAPCPTCKSRGKIPKKKCGTCHGNGVTQQVKEISISIPAGIEDQTQLKVVGAGEAGPDGHGDLYLQIRVKPHTHLKREGSTITSRENIPFTTAVLGGKIAIQTVDGEAMLDVPAGTQPGASFSLKGHGVPAGRGRGDHVVTVTISVPRKINARERELLEELKKFEG